MQRRTTSQHHTWWRWNHTRIQQWRIKQCFNFFHFCASLIGCMWKKKTVSRTSLRSAPRSLEHSYKNLSFLIYSIFSVKKNLSRNRGAEEPIISGGVAPGVPEVRAELGGNCPTSQRNLKKRREWVASSFLLTFQVSKLWKPHELTAFYNWNVTQTWWVLFDRLKCFVPRPNF